MKENSIIELENNENFIVLDKIHYENEIYYFCSKIGGKEKLLNDKVKFFISKKENDEYYMAEIKDKKIISELIKIVRNLT